MKINDINSYVVFDEEESGINASTSEIIYLHAKKIRNGEIIGKFRAYMKPNVPLIDAVEYLTGITNEELASHRTAEETLPLFDDFVLNNPIVCSHTKFVNAQLEKYRPLLPNYFASQIIDIKEISERIFVNERGFSDKKMGSFYNIDKHINGVMLCYHVFESIKKLMPTIGDRPIIINQEQLKEVKKMDIITALDLQKKFNWGYSDTLTIIDYLKIVKIC